MLKLLNKSYRCLWLFSENILSDNSVRTKFLIPKARLCKVSKSKQSVNKSSSEPNKAARVSPSELNIIRFSPLSNRAPKELATNVKTEYFLKIASSYKNAQNVEFNHTPADESQLENRPAVATSVGGNVGAGRFFSIKSKDFRRWESVPEAANRKRKKDHCPEEKEQNMKAKESISSPQPILNSDGLTFKILSYNVLAQALLEYHPYLYRRCTPNVLKWQYRATRLHKEIASIAPDIICLQEVQSSHITWYQSNLRKLGYIGIYKQKTGDREDGCAIYYKHSLFELKDYINVEFYQPELPLLNRDNIGLVAKFAPKSMPDTSFAVATTHLLYNPRRTDVRLAQIQVFLAEIDRFTYLGPNSGLDTHIPIILTGDLNSKPDSPVIQLLSTGNVSFPLNSESDWKRIAVTDNCQHLGVYLNRQKGEDSMAKHLSKLRNSTDAREEGTVSNAVGITEDQTAPPNHDFLFHSGTLGHSLALQSVYGIYKDNGQAEATTFQDYWVTVDYIYYSKKNQNGGLNLLQRLRLPTVEECERMGCLPNAKFGSDHLALAAKFELKSVKCML